MKENVHYCFNKMLGVQNFASRELPNSTPFNMIWWEWAVQELQSQWWFVWRGFKQKNKLRKEKVVDRKDIMTEVQHNKRKWTADGGVTLAAFEPHEFERQQPWLTVRVHACMMGRNNFIFLPTRSYISSYLFFKSVQLVWEVMVGVASHNIPHPA